MLQNINTQNKIQSRCQVFNDYVNILGETLQVMNHIRQGLVLWTKWNNCTSGASKGWNTYNASTSPEGNWLHFPEERQKHGSQFML